ncbi:fungal-specific transcription factor domain-containing protein [Aspergillus arachidicola]|uniref:Fungal-specific transcription factor domain-containing protein n=1 Tax=Aspergillus arachidicola TaxID=656916 RepID=A0A5N6XX96_9EURO|nr:fungal-specific transcription factor domain-containing protein [Aspergillus arachidicola]
MTAYDDSLNPFRKLTVMTLSNAVVRRVIVSHASEWMYYHGCMSLELNLLHRISAIKSLRQAIGSITAVQPADGDSSGRLDHEVPLHPMETVLTAVLLQVANSLFDGWSWSDTRLSCAFQVLCNLDLITHTPAHFISRFLVQRFAMLDLANALLRQSRLHLPLSCWLFKLGTSADEVEPRHQQMTGCPRGLVGLLAQICSLADTLADGRCKADVLMDASQLQEELHKYFSDASTRRTVQVADRHLNSLGECWYWCAYLCLQRCVLFLPTQSPEVQSSVACLIELLKSVPLRCLPGSKIFVPLCMAAREAINPEDRSMLSKRNADMRIVYPSRIRDETMALIEERWVGT